MAEKIPNKEEGQSLTAFVLPSDADLPADVAAPMTDTERRRASEKLKVPEAELRSYISAVLPDMPLAWEYELWLRTQPDATFVLTVHNVDDYKQMFGVDGFWLAVQSLFRDGKPCHFHRLIGKA